MAPRFKRRFYSIFGQCDRVAAEMMLERYPCTTRKISFERIPKGFGMYNINYNKAGVRALFAVEVHSRDADEYLKRTTKELLA